MTDPYGFARDSLPPEAPRVLHDLAAAPGRIRHIRTMPALTGRTADWPDWLPAEAIERFAASGITAPWQHQITAANAAREGRHVLLATGTASGKSLGYLLPIIEATRADPGTGDRTGTALYLSPTKALAHDQRRAARGLELPGWRVGTLDGDSDPQDREFARSYAGFVLSNPDMLHYSVLPRHGDWADFLARLRYVVIDEAHRYRGVFGAQVAAVVRRLRRLSDHHRRRRALLSGGSAGSGESAGSGGSARDSSTPPGPTFILASATSQASPDGRIGPAASSAAASLVTRLTGVGEDTVTVVAEDASPHAEVTHVLVEAGDGLVGLTAELLGRLTAGEDQHRGLQTVAFIGSRRLCEVIALDARERAGAAAPATVPTIEAYRGGYLPAERRALEARLNSGELRGVAATNALELGIDVAGLDAVVIAGLPGSLASYWQQAGRAGRRGRPALVVALGGIDQRDSYLLDHPELIFDTALDPVVLDPDNPRVLGAQLAAAAQELVLGLDDQAWFGPRFPALAGTLARQGILRQRGTTAAPKWYWTSPGRAVDLIDLRAQGGRAVQIVAADTGQVIGSVDASAADAAVHPEAVYLHRGDSYWVTELDREEGIAFVEPRSPGWTTQPLSVRSVRIMRELESQPFGAGRLSRGEVEVTSQVVGYLRRDEVTGGVLDENPLDLGVHTLRTRATWWTVPPAQVDQLGLTEEQLAGAAHGAEHCAIGLLSVFVPSDRWDVGGLSTVLHADTDALTVFIHDGHPGGAGFADRGYVAAPRWWAATRERLELCSCEDGCPACVISPKCGNANRMLDKSAAARLLTLLV